MRLRNGGLWLVSAVGAAALLLGACGGDSVILATTTSTENSGLLDVLIQMYEEDSGDSVKVIAVGSGAAMTLGERGDADVLLVHSPAAEEGFIEAGYGIERARVMFNDFVVVGPAGRSGRCCGDQRSRRCLRHNS